MCVFRLGVLGSIFLSFQVTLATYTAFVLTGHPLTAEKAFVSLSLFNVLRFPINIFPMMIAYIITASTTFGNEMPRRFWREGCFAHLVHLIFHQRMRIFCIG